MKQKIVIVFLLSVFSFFKTAAQDEPRVISKNWVKNQFIQRDVRFTMATPAEISRFDTEVLLYLERNDFSNVEPATAKLIFEIMTKRPYAGYHNVRLGFRILAEKFVNKTYFYEQISNVKAFDFMRDVIVITSVINELEKDIERDTNRAFSGLVNLFKVIDPYMAEKHDPNSQRIGTALISFIRKYMKLVEFEKLKDTKQDTITLIFKKMDFHKRESHFDRLKGAEDIREEYFFYIDGGF